MEKLKEAIKLIGHDVGVLQGRQSSNLTQTRAYELFPTYATLQSQMTTNIKEKHLELGLDALIDDKLKMVMTLLSHGQNCQRLTQVRSQPRMTWKS